MDFVAGVMSSEVPWAKVLLGVTVGVVVNAFIVHCYFRQKKKKPDKPPSNKHEIEIILPAGEGDTLGVINKYNELHSDAKYSTENTSESSQVSSNLALLEQQLLQNVQGNNLGVEKDDSFHGEKDDGASLAGAIRQQVSKCHTAIVHLQNRLQNESNKRQQAEDWCAMLEKELTAHLAARQVAETKCEKLHQKIKLLSRKLKLQERILRKRQKEQKLQQEINGNMRNGNIEQAHQAEVQHSSPPSGDRLSDSDGEDEEYCEGDTYTSFVEVDDEPHFASDLDEDKIVEPQELQKIIEAIDEVSDCDAESDEDFESEDEEPRTGDTKEGADFELQNDVMHQLVANAVHGDLTDLLSAVPDCSDDDDDDLSDLVAANMSEDAREKEDQPPRRDVTDAMDTTTEENDGDISSESIGNTKTTREFWEKKAIETDGDTPVTKEPSLKPLVHEQINKLQTGTSLKRAGSLRDPNRVSRIPVLKPSGKEYSLEAESVSTHPTGTNSHPDPDGTVEDDEAGAKLSIEAMKEHWEKNQRRWGSSTVINAELEGNDGNGNEGDTGIENGNGVRLAEIERSTDFKDLKEQWKKKNEERLKRAQENGEKDLNENNAIDRDKSPGFQALKEEWESKTQDPDESL